MRSTREVVKCVIVPIAAAIVIAGGCHGGPAQGRDAGAPEGGTDPKVWGPYPSPPLDPLVAEAVAKGAPPSPPVPYSSPAPVSVPQPAPVDLSALPRDDRGRPVLYDDGVMSFRLNPDKRDPVMAMGRCALMLSSCPQRADVAGRRTIDACWASAPICATDQPWTEGAACCPVRCVEVYRRLRELGYGELEANRRAVSSMCFNGLREQLGRP